MTTYDYVVETHRQARIDLKAKAKRDDGDDFFAGIVSPPKVIGNVVSTPLHSTGSSA
jgi:hypothetical protein